MNDGKGTVSVGSGTLPTGACVYCGKICETKNGACAECMGSPTVISGKFPTALAERFITYREEKSYPTSNALLMEILNSFFGYGRSQRPVPKDRADASAESASHPFFVPCRGSLPSDVLKTSASMCTLRDFRPALPPEYLCTSRVRLKICCGIRPRLKTIERLCASGTLRQVILPVTGVSP